MLQINVNDHTEKKNGLTYLSWAWAWTEALKFDPEATWEPVLFGQPDGTNTVCLYIGSTALVQTKVTMKGKTRSCMLPVMDHRNKAIPNPDAFAVNTAIMRCMTKALSMHGLGLYIYAGEDLPSGAPDATPDDQLEATLAASIEQGKTKRVGALADAADDAATRLEPVTKTALAALASKVASKFAIGPAPAFELIEEQGLTGDEKTYLWNMLDSKVRSGLKREGQIRSMAGVPA